MGIVYFEALTHAWIVESVEYIMTKGCCHSYTAV